MAMQPGTDAPVSYVIARIVLKGLFRILGGITSLGAENVPLRGPVIICPNHLSDCDPHAIFATCARYDVMFLAKDELFEMPVLGAILRALPIIAIKRDSADRAAIRKAEAVLNAGGVLVMFPEGRLSESGQLGRIQPGAALISLRTGAPIVPVGISRTHWFLPYGHYVPRFSRMPARVVYGKPIVPDSGQAHPNRRIIDGTTADLESRIRGLTGQ